MLAQEPKITRPGDRARIEVNWRKLILVFRITVVQVLDQEIDLGAGKASQGNIDIDIG